MNNNNENSLHNNSNYLQHQLNSINDLNKFIPHTAHHFMINSSSLNNINNNNKENNQQDQSHHQQHPTQDQEHAYNYFSSNSNPSLNITNTNSMQQFDLSKQASSFINSTNNCIYYIFFT